MGHLKINSSIKTALSPTVLRASPLRRSALLSWKFFAMSLILDETLVADIIQRIAHIQFQALDSLFKMPRVGAVWVVDDIAGNMGPIISPQALRDHVFPWYKKMAAECHKNDTPFVVSAGR